MPDIDLRGMPDHDLLVVAVTKINGIDEKLDIVCTKVEEHGKQLTVLQIEHDERKTSGDCVSQSIVTSKRVMIAGISGGSGVAGAGLTLIIQAVLKHFGITL